MSAAAKRIDSSNVSGNNANPEPEAQSKPGGRRLSIDAWAVILSLVLAGLVRLGVLKHITW
jgi:hypothetical protein